MSRLSIFALALILHGLLTPLSRAALIKQEWTIANKFVSPDGVEKLAPVVNGQYPGPELRGHVGDVVRITVIINLPTDTTSIHWHGVKQSGTPWSDGVPGITQCAIGSGQSFVYQFVLDAAGTLWWHSHSAFQKSSLYGPIIISGDEHVVGHHQELVLLVSDWYHKDASSQLAGLALPLPEFIMVGDPQSLLINGRGQFNCSATSQKCNSNSTHAGPGYFEVEPNTTYRLRIIGASSQSFLNIGIDAHNLTMIEAETTLLKPFSTRFVDVAPGQSYSALLTTMSLEELKAQNDITGLFWIQINIRHGKGIRSGLSILRYETNGSEVHPRRPPSPYPGREDLSWSLRFARKFKARNPSPLPSPERELVYLGTQNLLENGRVVWALNNISFTMPRTPMLHSMALDLRVETDLWMSKTSIPTTFDYNLTLFEAGLSPASRSGTQVLSLRKDEVVDIVFQNTRNLGGSDEVHPWHLHMHNFWVLGYGDQRSTWDPTGTSTFYDTGSAVSRNTMALYPGSWTAIRLKADNPGTAHIHCHILSHLQAGMGFVVVVGEAKDAPPPQPGSQFCGTVTQVIGPPVRNPIISGGCRA